MKIKTFFGWPMSNKLDKKVSNFLEGKQAKDIIVNRNIIFSSITVVFEEIEHEKEKDKIGFIKGLENMPKAV